MTRIRQTHLRDAETLLDAQTKIIDLNVEDPITAIDIIYQANNGATSNQGVPLHKDVDKIEIVDGADSLWALSMVQAQALNFYEEGHLPHMLLNEGAAATQVEVARINFGRWLGDTELYLDPRRFRNPQLKATHSLTISATAGFATGTGRLSVIAYLLEDRPPVAKGFLSAKEHYSWTTVASGEQRITLPRDYPYRFFLLRGYESGTAWDTDITKVKLLADSDKYVPWLVSAADLRRINETIWGKCSVANALLRTDGDTPEVFMAFPDEFTVQAINDLDIASIDAVTADTVTLQLLSLAVTPTIAKSTTDTEIRLGVRGTGPHHVLALPFGDRWDVGSWFRPMDFGVVEAIITQGGAGAAASVVLQQLRN